MLYYWFYLSALCNVKKNFSQRQSNNHISWHPRARKGLAVTLSRGEKGRERVQRQGN